MWATTSLFLRFIWFLILFMILWAGAGAWLWCFQHIQPTQALISGRLGARVPHVKFMSFVVSVSLEKRRGNRSEAPRDPAFSADAPLTMQQDRMWSLGLTESKCIPRQSSNTLYIHDPEWEIYIFMPNSPAEKMLTHLSRITAGHLNTVVFP